jgi:hypothetical protein
MSVLREIADRIDALRCDMREPARIEIGWQQAQHIADELNPFRRDDDEAEFFALLKIQLPPKPPRPTADDVYAGPGKRTLFGVPLVGVESPDYLAVLPREGP